MKDAPATLDRPPWCQACIEVMPKMPLKWIPHKAEPGSDLCAMHRQKYSGVEVRRNDAGDLVALVRSPK